MKMAKTVAVAGKGGTGKTTIAALLVNFLARRGLVLAVDADPSINLNQALGLPLDENRTIGRTREKMAEDILKGRFSPSVTKQDYMYGKIIESLVESKGFDLLVMGRPEGPGCYCAANEFLRAALDRLVRDYKYAYIVIDCEAGMEHISRQTTRDVDVLLLASDPTVKGITTAIRMRNLIRELRSNVGKIGLVVNRVRDGLSAELTRLIDESRLQILAAIPEDPYVGELEERGEPISKLPRESPLRSKVEELAEEIA